MLPIAVFDTNILVSGVVWRGNPSQCLELARSRVVRGLTCREILEELVRILRDKLNLSTQFADATVADLLSYLAVIAIPGTLEAVAADPDDDKVLECAILGSAQYVVTGDRRHLLPLGTYNGVRIVSAVEFLALVSPAP
jgi:putative PIN family toxin of toxin-antitoxin system